MFYEVLFCVTGMLYNRIWNNLELHINNVHIRYEDTHTCREPLVIGLCLQSLSADTTNQYVMEAVFQTF